MRRRELNDKLCDLMIEVANLESTSPSYARSPPANALASSICRNCHHRTAAAPTEDFDMGNFSGLPNSCTTAAFICAMTRASTFSEIGCPNWDDSYNSR